MISRGVLQSMRARSGAYYAGPSSFRQPRNRAGTACPTCISRDGRSPSDMGDPSARSSTGNGTLVSTSRSRSSSVVDRTSRSMAKAVSMPGTARERAAILSLENETRAGLPGAGSAFVVTSVSQADVYPIPTLPSRRRAQQRAQHVRHRSDHHCPARGSPPPRARPSGRGSSRPLRPHGIAGAEPGRRHVGEPRRRGEPSGRQARPPHRAEDPMSTASASRRPMRSTRTSGIT